MYDTSKLKGRIIEKYGSQQKFCKATNLRPAFVSQYLTGKLTLDQKMIDKWAAALDISAEEIPVFFFTKKVHDTELSA